MSSSRLSFLHQAAYLYMKLGGRRRSSLDLGVVVLARDLHLGCDGKRSGWEVYHPNFLARQLGYLQGCPIPLLSSRTVLSRGREPRSSEKKCRTAVREFQERCQKFRLRPATPETQCTDTFGEWWEKYTQEFFGAPVEDVLSRLFSDRPKKASAPHPQGTGFIFFLSINLAY